MGYNLKVNLTKLSNASNVVNDYKESYKGTINSSNSVVNDEMSNSWRGSDYNYFKERWSVFTSESSKIESRLVSFSSFLSRAYNEYDTMQKNLIDMASHLPK